MNDQDKQRSENLRSLAPLDAIQAWMDGGFGLGDESAMIEAIRKDKRVSFTDEEIEDIVFEAMDDGLDAPACLELLAGVS